MAGTVVEYPKDTYDFTKVQAGQSQTMFVERIRDVGAWTEATLLVRSHAHTVGGANASIVVEVRRTSPTPEDPNKRFVPRSNDPSPLLASVTINDATAAAPLLLRAALTASFSEFVEITVKGTQPSAGAVTLTADLSIALSLKARVPSASPRREERRGCE